MKNLSRQELIGVIMSDNIYDEDDVYINFLESLSLDQLVTLSEKIDSDINDM